MLWFLRLIAFFLTTGTFHRTDSILLLIFHQWQGDRKWECLSRWLSLCEFLCQLIWQAISSLKMIPPSIRFPCPALQNFFKFSCMRMALSLISGTGSYSLYFNNSFWCVYLVWAQLAGRWGEGSEVLGAQRDLYHVEPKISIDGDKNSGGQLESFMSPIY